MEDGGRRLRVEVLGPLRAYAGNREISLGAPKQRAVFAVLAMAANTVVARGELIDRIWGEGVPMTAAGNLHTYVSGLRRILSGLGDVLAGGSSGYLLRLAPEALDLNRAEQSAARARAARDDGDRPSAIAALDSALALWRSDRPLEALPGPFAAEQRARLANMRLRLLVDRTELMVDAGDARSADFAAAADELERHARAHPFDERLRSALMMALHRSGRTADALAQYQMLHRVLGEELGIEPEASTRAVQMAILAQDAPGRRGRATDLLRPLGAVGAVGAVAVGTVAVSSVASPVLPDRPQMPQMPELPGLRSLPATAPSPTLPAQLPRDSASFIGRSDEVQQVLAHAGADGNSSPRVVMVVGVGGIGKTTLAVRCGHLLRSAYPDGQIYINLRGFDPTHPALTPSAALHQLLASLGVSTVPAEHEQRVALWRSMVAGRRMVVLLDNARSAEQVEDLLPGTGSSFVMVTSRERLGRLAVKYAARRVTLAPLPVAEALGLLADAVGAARINAEVGAARRLAELCDHLPFALRIAAEQLVTVTDGRIADLVGNLEDAHQRLDTLRLENDDLCSVRSVMACSFDALDADTARACRMLGAFPGVSIGRYCAAALLDVSVAEATEVLQKLSAQHLLEQHGDRYTMHDLTRTYIRELARGLPDGEVRAARDRVSAWYAETLSQVVGAGRRRIVEVDSGLEPEDFRHEPRPFGGQGEFLRWCAQEWPNISALIRSTARSADHLSTWRLTYLMFDYFYASGSAADWLELLRIAMRSAEASGDRRARAVLLNHMGVAHCRTGQTDAAVTDLCTGLDLLEASDEPLLRVSLLSTLASVLRVSKAYEEGLAAALEAVALAGECADGYHRATAEDVLCELYAETGRWPEAVAHAETGLIDAHACGSPLLKANLLINLGLAHNGLSDAGAAQGCLVRALRITQAAGDRYHEGLALLALARVRAAERGAAAAMAKRALAQFQELAAEEAKDVLAFLGDLQLAGSVAVA
ncbi:winged helix-turn-helix domain-containing protein [Catenulispora sp. NL8]|uniref:Winged helix-turn-helix domain-containing protein n=1 Tax=Catenulispora pinistramenti TaxID=2705254 RepID=A0ABS5KRB5_9ACTN|nr:BTAD domain-containing putative transcriptional regulator [Catenulispora pinistramenti]MBS2548600.1 winged helix-turn-helix domain-containing protein [Catenulispora pinistramenti]